MSAGASAGALVFEQPEVADVAAVGRVLDEAFAALRDALLAGRAVIVVVRDDDLLGQRDPEAAALATALLGMVRALALEGKRQGWRVNALSHRGDQELEELIGWFAAGRNLSGQLVRATVEHLGRVWP